MGVRLIAAVYGLAEATLFFIVPDVYLSAAGVKDLRKALYACVFALAGAMAGAVIMYLWSTRDAATVLGLLDRIPGISSDMLARVHAGLVEKGAWAVLLGPLGGTPYKVYAAQAPSAGIGLVSLLLVSVPARLIRFVLVTVAARVAVDRIARDKPFKHRLVVLGIGWAIFYAYYFIKMPN